MFFIFYVLFLITEIDTECHETFSDTLVREFSVLKVGQK